MATPVYIVPSDFESVCGKEYAESLKFFHTNTQSARNKITELEVLFSEFQLSFDVIMLTETWYVEDNQAFNLPLYNNFVLNRTSGRGGGVSLMVKQNFSCEILSNYSCINQDYEILSLCINRNVVAVVYRPPQGKLQTFFDFLESILSFANENKYNLIMGGDFNINMLVDTPAKRNLEQLVQQFGCMNVIPSPTRITPTCSTLLDLFITNLHTSHFLAGVISTDISDHHGVYFCLKKNTLNGKGAELIYFQDISLNNLNTFRQKVLSLDWSDVFQETDADRAYNIFLAKFQKLYSECFPYRLLRLSKKIRKPWITPELLDKIQVKYRLYEKFLKTRDRDLLKTFKQYRNKLTKEIRNAKANYFGDIFSKCANNADATWRKLNTVLNRSCKPKPIAKICPNNQD